MTYFTNKVRMDGTEQGVHNKKTKNNWLLRANPLLPFH